MKKLFAILTATMLVCGLCVAPAYAIDFVGGWEFDIPDVPGEGNYDIHFYTGEDGQPELEIVSEDGTSEVIPGETLTQEEFESPQAEAPASIEWTPIPEEELANPLDQWLEDNAVYNGNGWRVEDIPNIGWYEYGGYAVPYYPLLLPDGSWIGFTQGTPKNEQDALVPTNVQDVAGETTDEGTYGTVTATSWDEEVAKQAAEEEFNKNHSSDGATITAKNYGHWDNKSQKVKMTEDPSWWPSDMPAPPSSYLTFSGAGAWVAEIEYLIPTHTPVVIVDPSEEPWQPEEEAPVSEDPVNPGPQTDPDDPEPIDLDDPVIHEEPNNDGPNDDTTEPGSDPGTVPDSDPEDLVIADESIDNPAGAIVSESGSVPAPLDTSNATDEAAQVSYPVQTGDHLGDLDSIIAITITVCLGALFLALCRKFEEE